eukprot:1410457-Pyramimonas_sp.AAC.1
MLALCHCLGPTQGHSNAKVRQRSLAVLASQILMWTIELGTLRNDSFSRTPHEEHFNTSPV